MKKNSNVDIFIYSHIPFHPIQNDHVFKVLTNSHAEAKEFNTDLEIFRDYTGRNISKENLMYNEYAGFYWLWKNYELKDYVGLNHYRRVYNCYNELPDFNEIFKTKKIILNEAINLVGNPGTGRRIYNNRDWYAEWHNVEDFDLLGEIIKSNYPQYADGFDKMSKVTFLHPSSLFTMPKDLFIEYCEFIFPCLQDIRDEMGFFTTEDCIAHVEKNKDKYIKDRHELYDVRYQSRIIGYLAERALGSFLMSGDNSLEDNAEIFKWSMVPEELYKSE